MTKCNKHRDFRLIENGYIPQEQTITFVDEENLATGGGRFKYTSYLTENTSVEDDITTYFYIIQKMLIHLYNSNYKGYLNIDFIELSNSDLIPINALLLITFQIKIVKLEFIF